MAVHYSRRTRVASRRTSQARFAARAPDLRASSVIAGLTAPTRGGEPGRLDRPASSAGTFRRARDETVHALGNAHGARIHSTTGHDRRGALASARRRASSADASAADRQTLPTRKADMVAAIERQLSDNSLRELWNRLDETQQLAGSEALSTPHSIFHPHAFKAKYGKFALRLRPGPFTDESPRAALVPLCKPPLRDPDHHPARPAAAPANVRPAAAGDRAHRRRRPARHGAAAPVSIPPPRPEAGVRSGGADPARHGTGRPPRPVRGTATHRRRPGRGERQDAAAVSDGEPAHRRGARRRRLPGAGGGRDAGTGAGNRSDQSVRLAVPDAGGQTGRVAWIPGVRVRRHPGTDRRRLHRSGRCAAGLHAHVGRRRPCVPEPLRRPAVFSG